MTRRPGVEQIWRYPIKSVCGEQVAQSLVDGRGLLGDRLWAVSDPVSGKLGSGKNSHRFTRFPGPALLELAARYPVEPEPGAIAPPLLHTPEGLDLPVAGGAAQRYLRLASGVPTLTLGREAGTGHFDDGPVSLIGTATLHWIAQNLPGAAPVDARRFRPNLVLGTRDPFEEEAWVGRTIRVGRAGEGPELAVYQVLKRCVMTAAAQHGMPPVPGMLKLLGAREDQPLRVAVISRVARGGMIRLGDRVCVL